jgi:ATP-dependent exoDNAse (exonuclease V) alpha subunit
LDHVRKWIESFDGEGGFEPLRLTVTGVAGSGKSTFIHTLVTAIRRLFESEDAVAVCGPTGSAAFNAGGSTCHHLFSLPMDAMLGELGAAKLKRIKQKLTKVVALVIDERSMLSSAVLAMMEHHCKLGAYRGQKCDQTWGGIPIVILVGDDYQLPSIDYGAIHIFDSSVKKSFITIAGESIFSEFAENVMKLDDSKRQHGDQTRMRDLLKKLQLEEEEEDKITKEDAKFLCSFCINNLKNFSESEVQELQDDTTLFLFANKEPRNQWNREQLFKQHSVDNPVAIIKSYTTKNGKQISHSQHYEKDRIPNSSEICRGAKVQLAGYNLYPRQGLYNGAMGIVKDIVFDESHSPNFGDFPLYVLVEFSQYDGMPLAETMKKMIPIVPQEVRCKYKCCCKKFIPLSLCYAKTIHTFQGQNAGPVESNQQPNPIQRIICDPGDKEFEGRNPGLFYTTFSRATTLGNDADKMSSAIYFKGANMTPDRVMNMRVGKNGRLFKRPRLRDQWVRKLNKNMHVSGLNAASKQDIFIWAKNTVVPKNVYCGLTKSN